MSKCSYITIVKTLSPINKVFRIDENGLFYIKGIARAVYVPDYSVFKQVVLQFVDDPDYSIIQGYYEGSQPDDGEVEGREFSITIVMSAIGFVRVPEDEVPSDIRVNGSKKGIAQIRTDLSPTGWVMNDKDGDYLISQFEGNQSE